MYEIESYRPSRWSGSQRRVIEVAMLLGAAVLIAAPAFRNISRRLRTRHPRAETEPAIDKALEDSFPASDPPASRYVDIPINRR